MYENPNIRRLHSPWQRSIVIKMNIFLGFFAGLLLGLIQIMLLKQMVQHMRKGALFIAIKLFAYGIALTALCLFSIQTMIACAVTASLSVIIYAGIVFKKPQ